jgi:cytidylate kinase
MAPDAIYLDTTGMPIEAVVDRVMTLIGERLK